VSDSTDQPQENGLLLPRRNVLGIMAAAGAATVITPIIGSGTAQASSGSSDPADDYYPIPEESGSIPWW